MGSGNFGWMRSVGVAAILAVTLASAPVKAQQPAPSSTSSSTSSTTSSSSSQSTLPDAPKPQTAPADPNDPNASYGKQPKRILGVIPNYRAVSANTQLPPLEIKDKFWLATQDTFDYSNFLLVATQSGIALAQNSQPDFGKGGVGYGRYYWHIFADDGIENYLTEAVVPSVVREDPRYYTLGKGGFFKRTGYAISRLAITRTDAGNKTLNISEIVGAGGAAGISNFYYHNQSNPFVKTYQRWGTNVGLDGLFNVLKEFWPDIDHAVFHGKY
jgi:hypothetical protein